MTLPVVLAGPIVRRADSGGVSVWLATSEELAQPELMIAVLGRRGGSTLERLATETVAPTVRLAERLWVQVLTATRTALPEQLLPVAEDGLMSPLAREADGAANLESDFAYARGFPAGCLLAYDVVEAGGAQRSLRDMLTLADITLEGMPLPTFTLQARDRPLHLLYGSCRKLHGLGPDAAPMYLAALQDQAASAADRPQVLILGGDQIYADDVADLLIPHLSALGNELMGRRESVPGVSRPDALRPRARADVVAKQGSFTAGAEGANHLMTFGEWAATYIFAWNPAVWPASWATPIQSYHAFDPPKRPVMADWVHRDHATQVKRLELAREGSASMRRTLANISTYMIFDDHEITDDWNIDPSWTKRVARSPLGTRLVYNGLAAYWAFQAWGNEPSKLSDVRNEIATALSSDAHRDPSPLARQTWSFLVPSTPRVVVLDTRTLRASSRGSRAARLLGDRARSDTNGLFKEARAISSSVVLVAPSPVWGVPTVEAAQSVHAWKAGSAAADFESWTANPRSKVDLIDIVRAHRVRTLVVLSGDVHYGFTRAARIVSIDRDGQRRPDADTLVAQFTSSATKNVVPGNLQRALWALSVVPPGGPVDIWTWARPGDAPVHTVETAAGFDPAAAPADPSSAEIQFATERYGPPAWIERSAFVRIERTLALDIDIIGQNNVGEVVLDQDRIKHRHRLEDGTSYESDWATGAGDRWPV